MQQGWSTSESEKVSTNDAVIQANEAVVVRCCQVIEQEEWKVTVWWEMCGDAVKTKDEMNDRGRGKVRGEDF